MNLDLAFSMTSFYVLQCLPKMNEGSFYCPFEITSPCLCIWGEMFGFNGQKLAEKLVATQISLLLVSLR